MRASDVDDGARVRRDYRCLSCRETFSVDRAPGEDAPAVCPVCGSTEVWESWESRVRNLGRTPSWLYEELRDRPG